MRVLAIDPGAKRLGYAVVEGPEPYNLVCSGIAGLVKGEKEKHGDYRWRLIRYWTDYFPEMIEDSDCDRIVSERQPIIGGNPAAAAQGDLTRTVVTVCQTVSCLERRDWEEMAGNSLKKFLTGDGQASKVKVRNAVIQVFPELLPRKKELTELADESDAIGLGIVACGYRHEG